MILTKQEYCDKYGISIRTLENRVKNHQLPTYHRIKKLDGRGMVIVIEAQSENCQRCESYFLATCEFNERKLGERVTLGQSAQINYELAAEMCVKYNLGSKFFKMVGV